MEIELEIEGVSDPSIADAIRKRVRVLRRQIRRPGNWRVVIAPSNTRGEWDLGVRDASGPWHLVWFTEPAERLPDVIEQILRARLSAFPTTDTSVDRNRRWTAAGRFAPSLPARERVHDGGSDHQPTRGANEPASNELIVNAASGDPGRPAQIEIGIECARQRTAIRSAG